MVSFLFLWLTNILLCAHTHTHTHTHIHTHTHTHTHTHMLRMVYYSAIKKDENLPLAATWMDLERALC